ncbi:MAG: hypothetical protein AAF297_08010 [Planctomycetota bacterium]
MTSAQRMLLGALALSAVALATLGGCGMFSGPSLATPSRIASPYDTSQGDIVWAVAPARDESGTSVTDPEAVSDALVAAASEVRGISVLPLNRTIRAMRALGIANVSTPSEAQQLASVLGADAVLVSTLTAWDPYDPPTVGLNAALFAAPGRLRGNSADIDDTRLFSLQATEGNQTPGPRDASRPSSATSNLYDARDHGTLMALRRYAEGRTELNDPLGWRVYLKSMPLYTTFSARQTVDSLLDEEWLRLARARNADRAQR